MSRGSTADASMTEESLYKAAGSRYFDRGKAYFDASAVGKLSASKESISGRVEGTKSYRVRLRVEGDALVSECSCPLGKDGIFCKHAVALGLAWLNQKNPKKIHREPSPKATEAGIRDRLSSRNKDDLVEMLIDRSREDDNLRQRMVLDAARSRKSGVDLATYRQAISEAFETDGFVKYGEMSQYSERLGEIVSEIKGLLSRHPEAVIELCEHALKSWEDGIERVDDSGGYMGMIRDDLMELHLKACKKARPDPEKLARRLFEWEMRSEWETFLGCVRTYARVFGKKGIAVYRELAEMEWKKVSVLTPESKDPERYGKRFKITHAMETLADTDGDGDALIEIKKRDLSSSHSFLEVARLYKSQGKHEAALEWAENGLKQFPQRQDPRLREFLSDEYLKRGRSDDAMRMIWTNFAERPHLDNYRSLRKQANRLDVWPLWRAKALDFVRKGLVKTEEKAPRHPQSRESDRSILVEIFLWEKDIDAAWREANEGGCSDALWNQLAKVLDKKRPEDALTAYKRLIEPTIAGKTKNAYRDAVGLLREIRRLYRRIGKADGFDEYLESVKTSHKLKKNFMKMLERARW